MTRYLCVTLIVALAASWAVLFMGKTGIRDYMRVHAPDLLSRMFDCDFCLSWWVCLLLSAGAAAYTGEWVLASCAFCSAPLARYLLI